MRRFTDREGRQWEVVPGRESWGNLVVLFIPVVPGPDIRQAPLAASGYELAEVELDRMGEAGLQELLDGSHPKTL